MHKFLLFLILFLVINFNVDCVKAQSNSDLEHLNQIIDQNKLFNLGLDDVSSYWGAWAVHHQPTSLCAIESSLLLLPYIQSHDLYIINIKDKKLCTPLVLKQSAKTIRPSNDLERKYIKEQWGISWDESQSLYAGEHGLNVKLKYPQEYEEEGIEGFVISSCKLKKISNDLWKPYNCHIEEIKGGELFAISTMEYFSRVAWKTKDIPGRVDKNGNIRLKESFTMK